MMKETVASIQVLWRKRSVFIANRELSFYALPSTAFYGCVESVPRTTQAQGKQTISVK